MSNPEARTPDHRIDALKEAVETLADIVDRLAAMWAGETYRSGELDPEDSPDTIEFGFELRHQMLQVRIALDRASRN